MITEILKKITAIKNPRGVTLTEVMFSAAITALVLVSVLVIFAQAVDLSKRIDYEYIATNLAKNRMERARTIIESSGFSYLSDLNETDIVIDKDGISDVNGDFRRATTVTTNHNGDPRETLVEVSVVYRYRGEWRQNASTTLATIFANIE